MDAKELIEKIYLELLKIKQKDQNVYATINEYDQAISKILPAFQKFKNEYHYQCYRKQIIKAIKLRLDEKETIKVILANFINECIKNL